MSQQTRISRFQIAPLGAGPGFLYANGRQQLAIMVSIGVEERESDFEQWRPRQMTVLERQTLTLMDIVGQAPQPPEGWTVTTNMGEFDPGPMFADAVSWLPEMDAILATTAGPFSQPPAIASAIGDDILLYLSTTVVQQRRFVAAVEIDGIGLVTTNMNLQGVIFGSFFDVLSRAPKRIHARELTRQVEAILPAGSHGWRAAQQFSFNLPQQVSVIQEAISGGVEVRPEGVDHHQMLRQGNQFYGVLPTLLDDRIDQLTPLQITGKLPNESNLEERDVPIRFSGSGLIRAYRFVDAAAWETRAADSPCVVSLMDRAGNESVFEVFANPANNEVYIRDRITSSVAAADVAVTP